MIYMKTENEVKKDISDISSNKIFPTKLTFEESYPENAKYISPHFIEFLKKWKEDNL